MNVQQFIAGRPCLEELDGYLMGLRIQIEVLDDPQYPVIDADVLGPIEKWRAVLMSGKEVPYPSRQDREWIYKKGRKPERKRKPMHAVGSVSEVRPKDRMPVLEATRNQKLGHKVRGKESGNKGKVFDLNARRQKVFRT